MSIPIKHSKSQEIDAFSCLLKTKYSTQDIKSPPIVFKNPIKKSIYSLNFISMFKNNKIFCFLKWNDSNGLGDINRG